MALKVAGAWVAMVVMVFVAAMGMRFHVGARADSVSIVNDMGPGVVLEVQCNSGSQDLGYHTIFSGLSYAFSFSPSWLGRDVYQCNFHAKGFPVKHMHVYEGINFFDNFCLCRDCHWTVTQYGFDCEYGQYQEKWK